METIPLKGFTCQHCPLNECPDRKFQVETPSDEVWIVTREAYEPDEIAERPPGDTTCAIGTIISQNGPEHMALTCMCGETVSAHRPRIRETA